MKPGQKQTVKMEANKTKGMERRTRKEQQTVTREHTHCREVCTCAVREAVWGSGCLLSACSSQKGVAFSPPCLPGPCSLSKTGTETLQTFLPVVTRGSDGGFSPHCKSKGLGALTSFEQLLFPLVAPSAYGLQNIL
jgi:hypothetical protein